MEVHALKLLLVAVDSAILSMYLAWNDDW